MKWKRERKMEKGKEKGKEKEGKGRKRQTGQRCFREFWLRFQLRFGFVTAHREKPHFKQIATEKKRTTKIGIERQKEKNDRAKKNKRKIMQ